MFPHPAADHRKWTVLAGISIAAFFAVSTWMALIRESRAATVDSYALDALQAPAAALQAQVRSMLGDGPSEAPPPDWCVESETELADYRRLLVTYAVEPDERATAWLLLPKSMEGGRQPLVICLHQTVACGKDEPVGLGGNPDFSYALDLVRQGFVCFAPDHFCAGARVAPGRQAYDTRPLYQRHPNWSAAGKALWDVQRALDVLVTLDYVDPGRIGVVGHSLGAHDAMLLAAADSRICAAVVNGGPRLLRTDPNRGVWSRPDAKDYTYYPRLRPHLDSPDRLPFDFDRVAMLVMPRPLLLINDCGDQHSTQRLAWEQSANIVAGRTGSPDALQLIFHTEGHRSARALRTEGYNWLRRRLASPEMGSSI